MIGEIRLIPERSHAGIEAFPAQGLSSVTGYGFPIVQLHAEKGHIVGNPAADFRKLIENDHISIPSIARIVGVEEAAVRAFLAEDITFSYEVMEQAGRLSMLATQLSSVMEVGDDERLTAILESLTIELHLTLENVARLTGIDLETIESFLSDPRSVSDDKKYALGLRCGSLMLAVENASPYWRVAPPTWPDPGPQPGAPQMSPRNHS